MQILLLPSDRKSDICNRMIQLRMLPMTLTYIFKVTKFEPWISRKRWKLTKHAQVWLLYRLIFAIEWDYCEVVLRGFDIILQGQIFKKEISLKWLAKHASYSFYRFWYLLLIGAIPKVVLCGISLLLQDQIFQMLIYRKRCMWAAQICQIWLL